MVSGTPTGLSAGEASWNAIGKTSEHRDLVDYEKKLIGNKVTHMDVSAFLLESLDNYDVAAGNAPQTTIDERNKWKQKKQLTAMHLGEGGFTAITFGDTDKPNLIELRNLASGLKTMSEVIHNTGKDNSGLKKYIEELEDFIFSARSEQES